MGTHDRPRCRDCKKLIDFALTEKGKRMPLDPIEEDRNHDVAATYALYEDVNTGESRIRYVGPEGAFDPDAERLVRPHFASCKAQLRRRHQSQQDRAVA